MQLTRRHPFDKDQLEIVFYQLMEALNQLMVMSDGDRNSSKYADALSDFTECREELNRQLDAIEAKLT